MEQLEMIPGTNRDLSLSQWLTPPDLARRVVDWALIGTDWGRRVGGFGGDRVLEPSAGNGALVRPLVAAGAGVFAVELDERYTSDLRRELGSWGMLVTCDFLAIQPPPTGEGFSLVLMNPPYENGLDVAFILHALKFAPRVVGIFRSQILHGKARKRELWSKVRPTRIAYLSERPDFGGDYGAMTDFVVLELVEMAGRNKNYPLDCTVEWW